MNYYKASLFLLLAALAFGCSEPDPTSGSPSKWQLNGEAVTTMTSLWQRPVSETEGVRLENLNTIQSYAEQCSEVYFKTYLESLDSAVDNAEKGDPVLSCYRASFDRILKELQEYQVTGNTVVIWQLYNMGYVVKTADMTFAFDIAHRHARKLAPYLDFLCITHNHSDHYNNGLIEEMLLLKKPVLSNYIRKNEGYQYTSATAQTYQIGPVTIKTAITDHNNSGLSNFVTVFRIDCGDNSDNFSILHAGDSNFNAPQFVPVGGGSVDVYIPRYAPNDLTENNVIGTGSGQFTPNYVLLSHILELTHIDTSASRWSVTLGLTRASKINCKNTYMPLWGDRMVFTDGVLQ